jgi:iron complex outermembrane receptor protein
VYGAQLVDARRDTGGFEGHYRAVNPRLGLIRDFSGGMQWYASASRVHEAPTTFELVDDSTGGADALRAMHGIALESGLRGSASRGAARYTWELPDAPGTSLSTNIPRTTHAGIEALLEASIAIGNGHRIEPLLSATFNAFSFDADPVYGNRRLPAAPRWFIRGEGMFRHRSGFLAGPTFDFVGPRYADFMNTYRSGTYGLLGARAGFSTTRWQVHAEVRNVLNRRHIATLVVSEQAGPDAQVLFPGAPRSVHLGVRGVF